MQIRSFNPWQKSHSESYRKISLFLCVVFLWESKPVWFGVLFPSVWNSCCSSINCQSETNHFPFWHLKRLLCWSVKLTIFATESTSRKTSEGICVQLIILPWQVTDPLNESTPKFDIWEAVLFLFWFDIWAQMVPLLALCSIHSSLVI